MQGIHIFLLYFIIKIILKFYYLSPAIFSSKPSHMPVPILPYIYGLFWGSLSATHNLLKINSSLVELNTLSTIGKSCLILEFLSATQDQRNHSS